VSKPRIRSGSGARARAREDQEHEGVYPPVRNWSSLFLNRILNVVSDP
jgi:hypothetical protein